MDNSGQFALNNQTCHQNRASQDLKTMAPRNYAGGFAKSTFDQAAYENHPHQAQPQIRCNNPPFYPTDMMYGQGVYHQNNQYLQPQYQNFQPRPPYQQQQECRQHYARISEFEQQKM
jgi:hypothetical protein